MRIIKIILKWLLAIFMVGSGVNHFLNPEFYLRMMPPYLPWHAALVYLSGVFEILLGVMLIIPRLTRVAAWGIIALLIAIFPANVYMSTNPQLFPEFNPTALLIRLPFQALFIAWAFWFTRDEKRRVLQN
jgi:uncharacterized membrane protein